MQVSNVLLVNEHRSGRNILPPMLKILSTLISTKMLITSIHLQGCGTILSLIVVLFESVLHGRIFLRSTSIMFLITQLQASIAITIAIT